MRQVKIKLNNGIDVTLRSRPIQGPVTWRQTYETVLTVHSGIPNMVAGLYRQTNTINVPISDAIRNWCWDRRRKYVKVRFFTANNSRIYNANGWDGTANIDVTINRITSINRTYLLHDAGQWYTIINELNKQNFKNQLKTNTTII